MHKVLITGADSGIGLAATELFLERGSSVIMADKSKNDEEFNKLKEQYDDKVYFYEGDLTQNDTVMLLFDYALEKLDGVDCIINNAGIIAHGYLHDMSHKQWDDVFNTDVKTIFLTSKFFVPDMIKKGGGSIVNTASISGLAADYKMPVYNAAKGAVVNLTRAMALDYGPFNIRVNAVCPGATDTPMLDRGSIPKERFASVNPLLRIASPKDIARAMYFLSSNEASYINGACLPVTGGLEVHTGQPK